MNHLTEQMNGPVNGGNYYLNYNGPLDAAVSPMQTLISASIRNLCARFLWNGEHGGGVKTGKTGMKRYRDAKEGRSGSEEGERARTIYLAYRTTANGALTDWKSD